MPLEKFKSRLNAACQDALKVAGSLATSIWIWDKERKALQMAAHLGLDEDYAVYGNQTSLLPLAKEHGPVYRVYRSGEPLSAPVHPMVQAYFKHYFEGPHVQRGLSLLHVLPLQLEDQPVGSFAFYFDDATAVERIDMDALNRIAMRVAADITVDAYRQDLAARIGELEELNVVLQRQIVDLERLSRNKTDMLGIVNHEMRTPLTSILGYADILRKRAAEREDPLGQEFLGYIHQSARRLQAITEDAMTAQMIENGMFTLGPEPCDLADLLRGVVGTFGPRLAATHTTIRVTGMEAPVPGECDPKRMAQVLTNVIGNALKFSPAGTTVEVGLTADDVCARFTVRDQGPGIPEDQLERIFEKYVQVDAHASRRQEGMGLGLMIARSIVRAHGGVIMIESKVGAGSTFEIEVPREAAEGLHLGTAPYILV